MHFSTTKPRSHSKTIVSLRSKISLFVGHSHLDAAGERMRAALNPGSSLYSKKTDALGRLVSATASVSLLAVS
jgi:predicted phosphodiesterase